MLTMLIWPPWALVPGVMLMLPRLAEPVTTPTTPPPPPTLWAISSGLLFAVLSRAALLVMVMLPAAWLPPLLTEPSWASPFTLPIWPPPPPMLWSVMAPEYVPFVTITALLFTVMAPPLAWAWLPLMPRLALPFSAGPM